MLEWLNCFVLLCAGLFHGPNHDERLYTWQAGMLAATLAVEPHLRPGPLLLQCYEPPVNIQQQYITLTKTMYGHASCS